MRIKAKKSLGQNFLVDKNIIKIILGCAIIENNEVLEVGPGTGNLTNEIINKKPKKLYLIEKDKFLFNFLKEKFNDDVIFINKDILKIDEGNISRNKLIVFGNLPYNISTEILTKWISNLKSNIWFEKLILMFQKEVADRIISNYNTPNYGRLSIISNWKLDIKKIIDIKPGAFTPRPKVDSTLLIFTPKKHFFPLSSSKSLEQVTRIFFNQKRKKIKRAFNQIFDTKGLEIAEKLNIDCNLRPQNLNKKTYYLIAKELEKLRG